MVMSTSSGREAIAQATGVPHVLQKYLVPCSEDLSVVALPAGVTELRVRNDDPRHERRAAGAPAHGAVAVGDRYESLLIS